MGFATNAIHVGQEPDPATGAIVAPIYQTSTYVSEELGKNKGYDYARTNHPNRKALERTVAKLEGGHSAYVFSSGMAGIDAVFRLLRPGDHVVLSEAVYGGVFRLSTQLLVHFGLEFSFVDTSTPDFVRAALRPNTKMIYIETPANPTLSVTDIAAISKLASERHLSVTVDNTYLSPYLQRPIDMSPHLASHPKVRKVFSPGLPSHPQHEVARRQQKGPGAMLSFDVGSLEAARRFLNHVKLCSLAESLGGVETLISLPAMMTHASMPKEIQDRVGITEGLVRLSVGIEDVEDIIADLDQALLYV